MNEYIERIKEPSVVNHPSVWKATDFINDNSWKFALTETQITELKGAVKKWEGLNFLELNKEQVANELPSFLPLIANIKNDLGARGFALLRGVPVNDLNPDEIKQAYWAIGLLFGQGLTQNAKKDFLCPVTDMGVDFGYTGAASQQNVRGYQSKADLNYHCDPTDIVSLLCVRKAMKGGFSSIVSTPTIYNEILLNHPELLDVLKHGFPYDRKAEQHPHEDVVTERIPVFFDHGSRVSCRYARSYILGGALKLNTPLTELQKKALDCFDSIAKREDMALKMEFEPGDIQFLNNLTTVHGRTSYEDDPDPSKRRFLWRLWLNLGDEKPWSEENEAMRWAFARFGDLGKPFNK